MTIPKDVLRFEVLLYLSLLLDALSAAVFGVVADEAAEATQAVRQSADRGLHCWAFLLVWLAARGKRTGRAGRCLDFSC